ncbi:hypothetical protein HMPREF1359_00254 [Enterococcus faecium E417]|nr:hypothetical protein HMPREF1359_00254 [Enterococcus faecium E417]
MSAVFCVRKKRTKKQLEERILFFLLAVFFLFNISYVKLCLIWLFFW